MTDQTTKPAQPEPAAEYTPDWRAIVNRLSAELEEEREARKAWRKRAESAGAVPPADRAAILAATLREVLDTFSPMHEVYGGPVSYYDGSADIEPAQYERWRAVLDGDPRMADETPPTQPPALHLTDTERDMLHYALDLAQERMFSRGDKFTDDERAVVDRLLLKADETQPTEAMHQPRRGDAVEQWLKAQRDEWAPEGCQPWWVLDQALDLYRRHADAGTPLSEHMCEEQPAEQQDGGQP